MPKVRIGENDFMEIPWNPDIVAGLIYRGFTVHPDDGIDPATYEVHKQQLEPRLRKLWGDKNLQAGQPQGTPNAAPRSPAIVVGEDPQYSYRGGMLQDVVPNPYINFGSKVINQQDIIDLQNLLNFKGNIKNPFEI